MPTKKHVLMIDDDPAMLRLFGGVLGVADIEVMYSTNGNDGREMARRFQPDLILLDLGMSEPDGFVTATRLKGERATKDIPIIFLTNADLTSEAEKALKEQWAIDYIHKSIDPKDFVDRIKKHLER